MEIEGILGFIFGFIIVAIIIVIVIAKRKKTEKEYAKKRDEQRKREENEKKQVIELKNKIENNAITKKWIEDIIIHCKKIISEKPTYDLSWEILTLKQDFLFGHNFQRVHYENINSTNYINEPITIFLHHFAELGLPEFQSEKESNQFSKAISELIEQKLKDENIIIELKEYERTYVYRSDSMCWFDKYKLYVLKYTRPLSDKSW